MNSTTREEETHGDGSHGSRIWISYTAGEVSMDAGIAGMEVAAEAVGASLTHAGATGSSEVYSVAAVPTTSCSFIGRGEAASEAAGS